MPEKKSATPEEPQKLSWSYNPEETGKGKNGFSWGPHKLPLQFVFEGVSIVVEQSPGGLLYRREGEAGSAEKAILEEKGKLQFSPVEPFHTPSPLSAHLLIDLVRPVVLEPRAAKTVFVTFPIELAAAFSRRRAAGERILDIFSLNRAKFTLYGSIADGLICKYWQSDIYKSAPQLNPLKEGVMELAMQNQAAKWTEVKNVVFSAQAMKIFYSPHQVSLKGVMKIVSDTSAETSFIDEPLHPGMNQALEQFSGRFLNLPAKTLMTEGH